MKTAACACLSLSLLWAPVCGAEHPVAEQYGWTELGGAWYSTPAYGPVRLEEASAGGAWGWSEAFAAWMFFALSGANADWRYIYHDSWRTWFTTIDQGERGLFPRLYLLEHTAEVEAASDAGVLWPGAPDGGFLAPREGAGWFLTATAFADGAAQTQAYAAILNTAIAASAEAGRILADKLQDASDPQETAAIDQALQGLNQAIAQSALGVTQALAQSISQADADPRDLALLANDYAAAYRVLTEELLQLAEDNEVGLFQSFAQALNGMSQALAQGYLGTTQALSQGYSGLQATRESGLPPERLEAAEADFRLVTDSYTFNYGAESASFAASTAAFEGQTLVAERFLVYTQAASQAHVGMTQSMAQSYLGVTQAIFEEAGAVIGGG